MRAALIGGLILAVVLAPFFLFEERMTSLAGRLAAGESAWMAGLGIAGLLAGDVFLPVPSSLISTAAGALLGFWEGTLVVFSGMTAACLLGYELARRGRRLLPEADARRMALAAGRYGPRLVVLFRAVPVLAEASVLFAGLARMPRRQFLALAAPANLGIALAYSAVGAFSMRVNSFLLAFAAAILLPLLAFAIARR